MSCDGLESKIGKALHERADKLEVSAGSRERLFRRLEQEQAKTDRLRRLSRFSWSYGRRIIVTMCVILCLSCSITFATGSGNEGRGWVTVSSSLNEGLLPFVDFENVEKLVDKLNYTPKYQESLAGGWEFMDAHISNTQRLDENNQRMSYIYKELYIRYRQPDSGQELCFVVSNIGQSLDLRDGDVTKEIGGVMVRYSEQPYKFVPVGYELTEEDKQAMAEDRLNISSGSSEIEEQLNKSVQWIQDGVRYLVFGWDLDIGEEEMFAIAEQFITDRQ